MFNSINPYGIYQSPQQRLNQMEQMYNQNYSSKPAVIGVLVMDRTEAAAYSVPMDGTTGVFINPAKTEIYTKKLRNNGMPEFKVYKEAPETPPADNAQNAVIPELQNEIDKLKKEIEEIKNNVQKSDGNDASIKPVKKSA